MLVGRGIDFASGGRSHGPAHDAVWRQTETRSFNCVLRLLFGGLETFYWGQILPNPPVEINRVYYPIWVCQFITPPPSHIRMDLVSEVSQRVTSHEQPGPGPGLQLLSRHRGVTRHGVLLAPLSSSPKLSPHETKRNTNTPPPHHEAHSYIPDLFLGRLHRIRSAQACAENPAVSSRLSHAAE